MKKIRLIATALVAIALTLSLLSTVAFAGIAGTSVEANAPGAATTIGGRVLGVAQIICWVGAVVLIMWMGIKWLTSAPEGKAEMKKGLIIASVAVILLVGAALIITYFKGIADEAFATPTPTE